MQQQSLIALITLQSPALTALITLSAEKPTSPPTLPIAFWIEHKALSIDLTSQFRLVDNEHVPHQNEGHL